MADDREIRLAKIRAAILDDIFTNNRMFLPGSPPNPDEVMGHFRRSILIDGLNDEEEALVQSMLPREVTGIYLRPLDKGLSGSKVYAAMFEKDGGLLSKVFVVKIGPREKINWEHNALRDLVAPHINNVMNPVYRQAIDLAIVAQQFVGVTDSSQLESFRYNCRKDKSDKIVLNLFRKRLSKWQEKKSSARDFTMRQIFDWHLTKVPTDVYPESWSDLQEWVKKLSGYEWTGTVDHVKSILEDRLTCFPSIVHGDLHTQNLLIDEHGECWPIDFAWTRPHSAQLVDLAMLECSLKYMGIPRRSDLWTVLDVDLALAREYHPKLDLKKVPYRDEIRNVFGAVLAVREVARDDLGLSFENYRKGLAVMTYCLTAHPELNRPLVLGSLQMLSGAMRATP